MSLRINQNVLSIQTYGALESTSSRLEKSVEKLSSGLRINRAADDAAGLAISEKLRRQVKGLSRAILNAQDGVSMVQSAEGALNESHSILQRMRELALQAGNDTLTSNDRLEIQKEVNQLRDDLNRISNNTEFNTKKLLDGSQSALISSSSGAVKGIVVGDTDGGGDYDVSIALVSGGVSEMQRSQIFTIQGDSSTLAKGTTQLQSIAQFYDSNSVFVLQNAQTITVSGNSKSATITLDGQMTLDKLAAALQNALTSVSGLGVSGSQAQVINTGMTSLAGVGGYVQLISGSIGDQGKVSFAGDQSLLNSLGMTTVRESENNLVELTLKDSFGNVTSTRTESNRATGLLDGIDLTFASQAAQIAGTKGLEEGLKITAAGGETFTISAGDQTVAVVIASGNWTMEGLARAIETAAVSISGLTSTVVDGQLRINFEPTTTTIASTIAISGATGALTLGFQNGTSSGFVDGEKDNSKAVWGFSNYTLTTGIAVTFSVTDGVDIGTWAAYSTVSTCVAADMVEFEAFQASANAVFSAANVDVRVDQIGGVMAFTALRVGQENVDNSSAILSQVTFNSDNTDSFSRLGLSNGSTRGSGDKNFKVHIVDNKPQFQIGADEGQIMGISIGNMGADALGVDNLDMTNIDAASNSLSKINQAIDKVSSERSKLGAFQNRLEYAINNLNTAHTNMVSAESRIRDADIAQEMIEFTRNQIVSQSGTAMLAQANLVPQSVLTLLK